MCKCKFLGSFSSLSQPAFQHPTRKGNCINQIVGIHSIGGALQKLPNFQYGQPCTDIGSDRPLQHFQPTLGPTLISLTRRHGGWKSNTVPKKYLEVSMETKTKMARMIQRGESLAKVFQSRQSSKKLEIKVVLLLFFILLLSKYQIIQIAL